MKVIKQELLKNVTVSMMEGKKEERYYSRATLQIDGYLIEIPILFFNSIDEAVTSIKERIVVAIQKFDK